MAPIYIVKLLTLQAVKAIIFFPESDYLFSGTVPPKYYQHLIVYTFHISLNISASDSLGSLTTGPAVM